MVSIRSLKKGDWVGLALINEVNAKTNEYSADKTYFLYFLTDTNCIVGLNKEYSDKDKYWFDLEVKELSNTFKIDRDELIKKVNDYEIEPLKYKRKKEKHWSIYERPKKEYNWKYDIACGANNNWVICKRDLLNAYVEELKNKKNYKDKAVYNCLVNSFDVFLEEISPVCNSHSGFNFNRPSYGGSEIKKKDDYYDVMLNNYRSLHFKYGNKVMSDIYYMLLDFEELIKEAKKQKKFSDVDQLIIDMIMQGAKVSNITDEVNKLGKTKKILTEEEISYRLTIHIPKILMKLDGELHE